MIPNPSELETPAQRRAEANSFVAALARQVPREVTLFGIEQHVLDLLDFRQDVTERISELEGLLPQAAEPVAIREFLEDARTELNAANLELAKLAGLEANKVDRCANLLRALYAVVDFRKEERDRHVRAAKRAEAMAQAVENMVMEALVLADRTRFQSDTNTLRMQRNSSPRVEIVDPTVVQSRFLTVTLTVSAERWKQAKEVLSDLAQYFTEKDRSFNTSAIAKSLKAMYAADAKIDEDAVAKEWTDKQIAEAKKQIVDRPRGAKLTHGSHLRVE